MDEFTFSSKVVSVSQPQVILPRVMCEVSSLCQVQVVFVLDINSVHYLSHPSEMKGGTAKIIPSG